MALICYFNEDLTYEFNETFSDNFFEVIDEIKPDFLIRDCNFLQQKLDCETNLRPILTEDGVCYTYNMLNRDIIYKNDV